MDHSRLDSELAEALELFPELDVWDDLPAARVLRAKMTKELQADLPPVDGVTSTDYKVPGPEGAPNVFVRVYRPVSGSSNKSTNNNDALPGMLWIHGGGYVWGSVDGDDRTVRCLVEAVACVVVSVEYRLAPEHPFPAPLDDCYAVLKWLVANAEELGVDSSRIAIGGISAGAGLAAG